MKLLVDIGNSRLKWAWLVDGELADPGGALHGGQASTALLSPLLNDPRRPGEVLIASVAAPALTQAIADGLSQGRGATVRLARTEAEAGGVRNGYVEPRQLGVDRWLAMIAAFTRYRTALCVVDAGTAVTVDAIRADGVHLGGFIVPGPALMQGALLRETGGIRTAAALLRSEGADAGVFGRDTETCIRLGAQRAIAGLVAGSMQALNGPGAPAGRGTVLVLTGGDAPALLKALALPADHRPLLVLEGLAARYAQGSP